MNEINAHHALQVFQPLQAPAESNAPKKRIYIAGKVSGLPYEEVQRKFNHAANYLKTIGFAPVNPLNYVGEDCPWQDAMRCCIRKLAECDGIYLLPDYFKSKGAILEHMIALHLELEIYHEC